MKQRIVLRRYSNARDEHPDPSCYVFSIEPKKDEGSSSFGGCSAMDYWLEDDITDIFGDVLREAAMALPEGGRLEFDVMVFLTGNKDKADMDVR